MASAYIGLFFTSMAALMLEILLTRIFSVATWYYFAFFAISVAMFGFTVGALFVYLRKDYFPDEALYKRLAVFSILFGFAAVVALLIFLSMPFYPRFTGVGLFSTVFIYLVIAAPFFFAGVIVCLCLTRFPSKVAALYAFDLIGAGIGAFMVFPVLNAMDAPTAVFLTGSVAALAGLFFERAARLSKGPGAGSNAAAIAFIVLTAFMLFNFFTAAFRVEYVKTSFNRPETELWNAFSRIAVYKFKLVKMPYSWGISRSYKADKPIGERMLDIDGVSETVMTYFDGDIKKVEHLKYDVTAIAHYLKKDAKVFIIGVGGGRDILAAKAFGQKEIVGAEINNRIIQMMSRVYGGFTGHLDKLPGVRLINDEARSAITRMDEEFDIIQASCIATWSATTAGAFSLSENSLYTVEAWKVFLGRLKPDGVLSFNRWYSPDYPAQLLRLAGLASYTLKAAGIQDPSSHIAIVRSEVIGGMMPSATILVSKTPFSAESIKKLRDAVDFLKFKFVYDPQGFKEPAFDAVVKGVGDPAFHATTVVDLTPPTDDRPFFFYMLRLKDAFSAHKLNLSEQRFSLEGITMLWVLMLVSAVLSIVFIFGPLLLANRSLSRRPLGAEGAIALLFFAAIGFGYILVEIGLLQRLITFLGHPVYSITVVIFSMLVSSGLGSMACGRLTRGGSPRALHISVIMAAIALLLAVIILRQTDMLYAFERSGIAARIGVSLLFLAPIGFFMGFPFPLGMTLASINLKDHTPWFWAVNGATSVVSSVLSVCISISAGFTATLTTGLVFYILAAITLLAFRKLAAARRQT